MGDCGPHLAGDQRELLLLRRSIQYGRPEFEYVELVYLQLFSEPGARKQLGRACLLSGLAQAGDVEGWILCELRSGGCGQPLSGDCCAGLCAGPHQYVDGIYPEAHAVFQRSRPDPDQWGAISEAQSDSGRCGRHDGTSDWAGRVLREHSEPPQLWTEHDVEL